MSAGHRLGSWLGPWQYCLYRIGHVTLMVIAGTTILVPYLLTLNCSLCRQDISSHDIDYVEYVDPGLTWGRTLSTCVISIWSNDIKCKCMFMFPLQNLARKEVSLVWATKLSIHSSSPSVPLSVCPGLFWLGCSFVSFSWSKTTDRNFRGFFL